MSKTNTKPEDEAEEAPARPKSRARLMIVVATLLLGGGGAAAAWMHMKEDPQEPVQVRKSPPAFVPLEIFTVNLADRDHYLQLGLTYEVAGGDAADRIKGQMPALRSRVLMLLSSKSVDDLATGDGKTRLSQELVALAREVASDDRTDPQIGSVHYSAFVIQ